MNFRMSTLFICLLLAIIGISIACSCLTLKEGLEMAKDWKTKGTGTWYGSYNVPSVAEDPTGMSFLANNPANADCCKTNSSFSTADGCMCISTEQYTFLKQRGGNNTQNDGLNDGW
jgi:hypothetical protein